MAVTVESSPIRVNVYPDQSATCKWVDIVILQPDHAAAAVADALHRLQADGMPLTDELIRQMTTHDARAAVHLADHDHLSLVFHAILLQQAGDGELALAPSEIEIAVGADRLITVRDATLDDHFERLREIWQHERPGYLDGPMAFLLYRIFKSVILDYHEELEGIPEQLVDLERAVSESPDRLLPAQSDGAALPDPLQAMQRRIFNLSRVLLEFRKFFGPLRRVLDQICELAEGDSNHLPFSLEHTRIEFYDLRTQTEYLIELVDTYRDMVTNVIGAYQSSMSNYLADVSNQMADASNRLNMNMQRLTVITAILATASTLVGFYGMNVGGLGIGGNFKYGAAAILVAIGVLSVVEYWYFKRKGWV